MKIRWMGQSCFYIVTQDGTRILTDPFNEGMGLPLPRVPADVVTVSHQHFDHNNTAVVEGSFTEVNAPGQYAVKGVEILGVPTFHDKSFGSARGKNTVFKITADGLSVLHCGDLGHLLDERKAAELGRVDVLLVPVGGHFTIDSHEAAEVMRQLNPALTIPMHYKLPGLELPITTVDSFLQQTGGKHAGGPEVEVTRETLPQLGGVLALDLEP